MFVFSIARGRLWGACLLGGAVLLLAACGREPAEPPVPADPVSQALLRQGTAALRQHAFGDALALADSAERHASGPVEAADAYFLRGLVFYGMERYEASTEAYEQVVARRPDYPGVWNNLGNNAYRLQQHRAAFDHFRRELARAPAPLPWHGIGLAYAELGAVDSARQAFGQALGLDSTFARAHLSLGLLLEREGEVAAALRHARRAFALAPQDLDARYLVGQLLLKAGQPGAAEPHLRAVAAERPWHYASHYNLAQALQRLGRADTAQAYFERAAELSRLQDEIAQEEADVRAYPEDAYARAELAHVLRRAGRYDDALQAYATALQLDPGNLAILHNLAALHLVRGDMAAAQAGFEDIVARDPAQVHAWINLGILHARSGRADAAAHAWREALRHDPGNAQAQAYLGRLQRVN